MMPPKTADRSQLDALMEALPIAVVLVDGAGRIAFANREAHALLGDGGAALVGRAFDTLVSDGNAIRADGSTIPVELARREVDTAEGRFSLAAIHDVSERRRAEEHLRLMVEAAPNAIVVADDEGRITLVNAQLELLLGYDRSELLGEPVERLVPTRSRGAHPPLRRRYAAHPTARPMGAGRDLSAVHKDGSEIPVEIGLSPITTPRGNFILASIIDIRERLQIEELRLRSAGERRRRLDAEADRDRARDASQLKSQFVATMSHELRTPLNAIIGMAELLGATRLDDRQRGYVRHVDESAEALLAIINSILDFSKIEARQIELETKEFSLESVVSSAAGVLADQARRKRVALHTYVDPLIPEVLCGDADRLRQVLVNLIGNAVKFTDGGQVVVRALPLETAAGSAMIRIEVQDTGIGIAPDVVPKLFEPFVQGDGSSARRYGGTGLGLSISKRIVEAMGGEIGVSSESGAGSLFWFTAGFAVPRAEVGTPRVAGAGALVFSEDQTFAEIAARYLHAWGMVARLVASEEEARRVFGSAPPDGVAEWVAIVDVETQRGDGIAAGLATLPGLGRSRTIRVGPDERISEPLRASLLFDTIVDALADEQPPPPAVPTTPAMDRAHFGKVSVLVAEDNTNMHEVLVHQFDALGVRVTIVSDGAEAVAAVRRKRFDLVLMDCQMPDVDGFEATREIRADERTTGAHIPIVAMTANAFKEDRDACLAAGMDDYLSKPVRLDDLRGVIERWAALERSP